MMPTTGKATATFMASISALWLLTLLFSIASNVTINVSCSRKATLEPNHSLCALKAARLVLRLYFTLSLDFLNL